MNNIHSLDLNLLKILLVILEEKNLTRAGERIGLSQSAVSHALKRLRDFFDDALVIRKSNGVALTLKAEQLHNPLKRWLGELEFILTTERFNPSHSSKVFTIACMDVFEQMIAPVVVNEINKLAPGIHVHFIKLDHRRFYQQLITNEVDLVIGVCNYNNQTDILEYTLYTEIFASMVRDQHPILTSRNRLKSYLGFPHIMVSLGDGVRSPLDRTLERDNLNRNLKYTVSNFSSAPYFVTNSDVIVTAPKRFLELCAKHHNGRVFTTPVTQHEFPINMYWAQKFDSDQASRWLRNIIVTVTSEI